MPASLLATVDSDALFLRWDEYRDVGARDTLIERFLPLARKLARRYAGANEPYDDLVQVASLGLVKAVERYDPKRGFAFSSFAVPTIVGELKRYFRDASWALHVDRSAQERARRIAEARREISSRQGRSPTVAELAEYLECSEEEVLDGLQTGEAYDTVSLDAPRSSDGDAAAHLDTLGGEDDRLERVDEQTTVFAAAQALPERERKILWLRFGEDLTQAEIADHVGVSQMQVSRLLRKSVRRLQELVHERPHRSSPSER
ncbi:MAG: SigB/SigF/SigG family RNA polymerase sigma factor [Solirubrobacterales bacterium]|nr:SigB/SigF/SigG family RNA polymerase sigma factor [Solirubrobacterales bacterium]